MDRRNQGSGDSGMSSPECSSPKGMRQTSENTEKHGQRTDEVPDASESEEEDEGTRGSSTPTSHKEDKKQGHSGSKQHKGEQEPRSGAEDVVVTALWDAVTHQDTRDDITQPVCMVYMDDIIVYSPTFERHQAGLEQAVSRMDDFNLTFKAKKCFIGEEEVKFLGHVVSADGVKPDPDKTKL